MNRLTFSPEHDIERTRHTLAYGQYRFLDRVWAGDESQSRDEAS